MRRKVLTVNVQTRFASRWILNVLLGLAILFCSISVKAIAGPLSKHERDSMLSSGIVAPEIVEALESREQVRVIFSFNLPGSSPKNKRSAAYRSMVSAAANSILATFAPTEFKLRHKYDSITALAGEINSKGVMRLTQNPDVTNVGADLVMELSLLQSVPLMNLDYVQGQGYTGSGITVAVIDTGIDTDHPDLADDLVVQRCYCGGYYGGCCPDDSVFQTGPGSAEDDLGHGTHVSGMISSGGIVAPIGGAPDAGIISIKVFGLSDGGTDDGGYTSDIVAGLDWVYNNRPDVDVINMSLGEGRYLGECDNANVSTIAYAQAINNLRNSGVPTFVASGNDGWNNYMNSPACVSGAISVGASYDADFGEIYSSVDDPYYYIYYYDVSTGTDKIVGFSNRNSTTDVFAPGYSINSSALGGGTTNKVGTSMATPAAASCAAALLQADGTLSVDELEALLESSPARLADPTKNYSFPRVDCQDAYDKLTGSNAWAGPGLFNLSCEEGGVAYPENPILYIRNASGVPWSLGESASWLDLAPGSGTGDAQINVSADCSSLAIGTYNTDITITGSVTPSTIPVSLTVVGGHTVGNGFYIWSFPFYDYYHDARTQAIYLASEIGEAGAIRSLALDVLYLPFMTLNNFTIRMKHTSLSSYSSASWEGPSSGWTTVYQGNVTINEPDWRTFTFSTPFAYNGSNNLMIDFSFDNNDWSDYNGWCFITDTGVNRSTLGYSDSLNGSPLNWSGTSNPDPYLSTAIPNLKIVVCVDNDGDGYGKGCALGQDCDDTKENTWNTCATCNDDDSDTYYELCNQYIGINGPDNCDDDINNWNAPRCANCADGDGDNYYDRCDSYAGLGNGSEDNCDGDINNWTLADCAGCVDVDADIWFAGCDFYATISGPDCNDGDTAINPGLAEVMCDGKDNDCNAGTPDDKDEDSDGLWYCEEVIEGTSDTNWDSDGDYIPDGYEVLHSGDALPLDPLNPFDGGTTDFDSDTNPNVHEYWNLTDPWTWNPVCGEGCFCWGDAGGDGTPDPTDIVELGKAIRGLAPDYTNVLPTSGLGQDLDGDGTPSPIDITELKKMVRGLSTVGLGSRPFTLVVMEEPGGTVAVGGTCHVTVGVLNDNSTYSPSFGVVFKIGAASTGTASILGGEGDSTPGRYDVSENTGASRIVLKIESAGEIEVEAGIPGCGVPTVGRYCPLINLTPVVTILGE